MYLASLCRGRSCAEDLVQLYSTKASTLSNITRCGCVGTVRGPNTRLDRNNCISNESVLTGSPPFSPHLHLLIYFPLYQFKSAYSFSNISCSQCPISSST